MLSLHAEAYRSEFGANHQLTKDVQDRIEAVRAQLAVKCVFVPTLTLWQDDLKLWCSWLLLTLLNRGNKHLRSGWRQWLGTLVTGWSQWLRNLIRRPPATKTEATEADDSDVSPSGWRQWLGTLVTGWSQWLRNLIRRPPATKTKATEADDSDVSPSGWRQWLGTLVTGWRPPATATEATKTKVSLKSGQSQHM